MSSQLHNQLREDDIEDVDAEIMSLSVQQFGMNTEIIQAQSRQENIKTHLEAAHGVLTNMNQKDAAGWLVTVWNDVIADHQLIASQDVLLTGMNAANVKITEQRDAALYERDAIDKAIAEGRSDDPALRDMLRSLESDAYYVVWTRMDEVVCKLFPNVPRNCVHTFMNALSGGLPFSNYQYELLAELLSTFEQRAAAS